MRNVFAALLLMSSTALAQESGTAYEALRVIGTQLNREYVNHVVSVTGTEGNPQPARWNVVVADRQAGMREIQVAQGRVVSNRPVAGPPSPSVIQTSKLNLDSSGAYAVAAHTADTSHVVFSLVNYTLRTDHRGNPTWIVALQTNRREPVGTIHIGANKGNVTRVEGMYQGRNMEQVETEKTLDEPLADENDPDSDGDENIIKRRIKQMFRRTRRDAERVFERVQESFEGFLNRRR